MPKGRLEAFSDGVIAILITIMVLELHVPHGGGIHALRPLVPVFFTYLLSFVYLGIYWNNHHHMLQAAHRVNGVILWANLHLLFWLSLFPSATGWMGENHFAPTPCAAYGVVCVGAAVAYYLLQKTVVRAQGEESGIAEAIGRDVKGKLSPVLYIAAVPLAFVSRWISVAIYVVVAGIWLIPDRRMENHIVERAHG
ncbi:MAG TPA: TMEM175 family protein [Mycobacteriales bacterium]|jgi:uncharacterized membrane protein|nr:TMEM175 family protein [Mycobacteriales bacterium]